MEILKTALKIAAEELYQSQVVDTDTVSLTIGPDQEFSTVEEWIESQIDYWIEEAEKKCKKKQLIKSLFNEYESYNGAGSQVSEEVSKAIFPIIKKWAETGYKTKDIEAIIIDNTALESAFIRAEIAVKQRKDKAEE